MHVAASQISFCRPSPPMAQDDQSKLKPWMILELSNCTHKFKWLLCIKRLDLKVGFKIIDIKYRLSSDLVKKGKQNRA